MEIAVTNAATADATVQQLTIASVELFAEKEIMSARETCAMTLMLPLAFLDIIPLLMFYVVKDLMLADVVIVSE